MTAEYWSEYVNAIVNITMYPPDYIWNKMSYAEGLLWLRCIPDHRKPKRKSAIEKQFHLEPHSLD